MTSYHSMSKEKTAQTLKTDIKNGLSNSDAAGRLQSDGKNILKEQKRPSLVQRFFAQFNDFMIIILLAAALVSLIISRLNGDNDFTEPLIILAIVVLNALLGVFQEAKAQKSIDALKKISAPHARVIRDGKIITVDAADVVTGDILVLKAGEIAAADCRLIESANLFIDESALTGESDAVAKEADISVEETAVLGDRINMVYASTEVTGGRGCGIVTETGMNTEVGKIAKLLMEDDDETTPLQRRLESAGKVMGVWALVICAMVFVVGLYRRLPAFEMFMTSVSLAVAAIPEGLPAIVTIMLAIGLQKMAKRNAIVRHLPSVETLGSASVICSDKTGTLTQNKMTVKKISGGNYTLELMSICSEANDMNPTERAILEAAEKAGLSKARLDQKYPRISEIPFDSNRKRMTTLNKWDTKARVITKGAAELILPLCGRYFDGKSERVLTETKKREILKETQNMADKALRVIGVCYKNTDSRDTKIYEKNMVFAGLAGMQDPPRKEAADAVKRCRQAGIKAVMITGDHPATAKAVAEEVGILKEGERVITGAELDKIPQEKLADEIAKCSVFARVTPEHKTSIVRAWKKRGAVVAMTGDGVNDAPALRAADIGCSMGISGTDVAKSASDMILTDDNFATIVEAVKQGRGIYSNIRKAVQFLLSSNIGEIITVFAALLMGCPAPLLPIQLLWVNLVTDSLPAIALGVDPVEEEVMHKPPRPANEGIFAGGMGISIVLEGIMIGALALIAFSIGRLYFDGAGAPIVGRTMAFATLSISQLFHAFNMRSEGSLFKAGLFKNMYLVGALLAGIFLQMSVIMFSPLGMVFRTARLTVTQWGIVGMLSIMPIIIVELQKFVSGRKTSEKF